MLASVMTLVLRQRAVDSAEWPLVMGILNVTPDSFSDGGRYLDAPAAIKRGRAMIAEGADIIDVGPESTRPGSAPVPAHVQIDRAIPVIAGLRHAHESIVLSVDTCLAPVAEAAMDAGADMVNDTSALRDDSAMPGLVASRSATVCLMHRRGSPMDMQQDGGPHYDDVVDEICTFLRERAACALKVGVEPSRIVVDPGIGFGKGAEDNLVILKRLDRFCALGYPVLVGASRKRFIGHVLGEDVPSRRDTGSLACAVMAALSGAAILRVHDVLGTVEAVRMVRAVRGAAGR